MAGLLPRLGRTTLIRTLLATGGAYAVWWLLSFVERLSGSLQVSVATIGASRPQPPVWLDGGGGMDLMYVCNWPQETHSVYLLTFIGSMLVSTIMAIQRRSRTAVSPYRRILR